MRTASISRVQAYLGCPLKYRFQYVDEIPPAWRSAALALGSSIHAAIEQFNRERLEGKASVSDAVASTFEADWYAQNIEPLLFPEREDYDSLLEKGRAMVAVYIAQADGVKPTAVEERFEVDLLDPETGEVLDLSLHGIVDLVEEGDVLVDVKTAARAYDTDSIERHLQLSAYALAYFLTKGTIPKLRLDVLLKTKTARLDRHTTTRSLEDLAWTARLIGQVVSAIEAGTFFPNPSWRCSECEYFAHCQSWRG
jgi:putative RecB family exonuclease